MIIISPAKKLDNTESDSFLEPTIPVFDNEARFLADQLSKLSTDDLKTLMGVSNNIVEVNVQRFRNWGNSCSGERRAIFQFKGDVFKHLNPRSLSQDDIDYMNNNLRILSGIYGILKPSDEMNPYRLEMGTRLNNKKGKNLYEFWGDSLSVAISQELKEHKDKTVINCASNEYFKSIYNSSLNANIITPEFKEIKNGKTRMISIFAKRARGMMARFIVENRIEAADRILDFNMAGYKYNSSLSEDAKPVFTRVQP